MDFGNYQQAGINYEVASAKLETLKSSVQSKPPTPEGPGIDMFTITIIVAVALVAVIAVVAVKKLKKRKGSKKGKEGFDDEDEEFDEDLGDEEDF